MKKKIVRLWFKVFCYMFMDSCRELNSGNWSWEYSCNVCHVAAKACIPLNLKYFFFKYEMGHVTGVQNIAFFLFLNIL